MLTRKRWNRAAVDLLNLLDTLGSIVADNITETRCKETGSNSVTIKKPYHQVSRDSLKMASVRKQKRVYG